jgi:hypothetical protein
MLQLHRSSSPNEDFIHVLLPKYRGEKRREGRTEGRAEGRAEQRSKGAKRTVQGRAEGGAERIAEGRAEGRAGRAERAEESRAGVKFLKQYAQALRALFFCLSVIFWQHINVTFMTTRWGAIHSMGCYGLVCYDVL